MVDVVVRVGSGAGYVVEVDDSAVPHVDASAWLVGIVDVGDRDGADVDLCAVGLTSAVVLTNLKFRNLVNRDGEA